MSALPIEADSLVNLSQCPLCADFVAEVGDRKSVVS
jgi:hypothetical protein